MISRRPRRLIDPGRVPWSSPTYGYGTDIYHIYYVVIYNIHFITYYPLLLGSLPSAAISGGSFDRTFSTRDARSGATFFSDHA
jgi:hypothetical protein